MDISKQLTQHQLAIDSVVQQMSLIETIADAMVSCLQQGGKVLWMGNGGSAADAQHLAAEFVVRYVKNRQALASLALTTDSSILTAHPNDFEFDTLFSRQVEALCQPQDVVVGISTSGNSVNVVKGLMAAKAKGAITVSFTGKDGGQLMPLADYGLNVCVEDTARIQEAHMFSGHLICDLIDKAFD